MIFNKYTGLGFAAVLLWSTTVALARSISEQTGPVTAGATVYLTGGVLSFAIYASKRKRLRDLVKISRFYLFGCGVLFIVYTASLFLALGLAETRYQTLELGLVNYLWPALTILFSLVLLRVKADLWLIPGTLLAITGVYFVTMDSLSFSANEFLFHVKSNAVAYFLALTAAFTWALYSNLVRLTAGKESKGVVPVFILSTGIVLLFVRYLFPESSTWNIQVIMEILILGISTALAYIFWDAAMRKGEMITVAVFSYLTPFFSTVFASVYLGVLPGSALWTGCILIILGSVISWRSVKTV